MAAQPSQHRPPMLEFVGGPWDGSGCPVEHENVFYDHRGQAHIFARSGKQVIGEYALDQTVNPPLWRWTRRTDEEA